MSMNYIEDGLRQSDNALFMGLKWFNRLHNTLHVFKMSFHHVQTIKEMKFRP